MNLPKIIYDIRNVLSNGELTDDSKIDNRLIYQWVNNQRNLWLVNSFNKNRPPDNTEIQVLRNVELEAVNDSTLTGSDSSVGVLKTKIRIPRTIQWNNNSGITSVRRSGITSKPIQLVHHNKANYVGNGMFNYNGLFAFRIDDFLYIKHGKTSSNLDIPKSLDIYCVLEDPLNIDTINKNHAMWEGDSEYPVGQKMIEYMKGEVFKSNISLFLNAPKDIKNDDENLSTGR